MLIRRAGPEDSEAVWRVHVSAIREICGSHYTPDEVEAWTSPLRPQSYERSIEQGRVFVAEEGGEIVGFGTLNVEQEEIEAVYVSPATTRRGIGMKLLQALEAEARRLGLANLRLSSSLNAVEFYWRAGYRSHGSSKHRLGSGVEIACVLMRRELK